MLKLSFMNQILAAHFHAHHRSTTGPLRVSLRPNPGQNVHSAWLLSAFDTDTTRVLRPSFNFMELVSGAVTEDEASTPKCVLRCWTNSSHCDSESVSFFQILGYRRKIIRFRFRVHKSKAVSTRRVAACLGTRFSTLWTRSNKSI
jgi:hypothetical protein